MEAQFRRSVDVEAGDGCRLHAVVQGTDEPALLLLHGFPDRAGVWRRVLDRLRPERLAIAPDGRGVNLSDKPEPVEAYALPRLVADVLAVADALAPGRPVDLVGHDWGGVVAWAAASLHPERFRRLVVLNAPHPQVLADALTTDAEQRAASAYFDALRAPGAEHALSADRFARLRSVTADLRRRGVLGEEDDTEAVEAWSRPGALTGALNWYRAATWAAPEGVSPVPCPRLEMPVLLLWGEDDRALPPRLAERHRSFCPDLKIRVLPGVGHWPQLEQPDIVAQALNDY